MTEFHSFIPVADPSVTTAEVLLNECETCGGRLTDTVHFHPLTQEN